MKFRYAILVAWAAIAFGMGVRADDWLVDNVGGVDDIKSFKLGRSLKTIQFALNHAQPGDRIILKKNDVPYREEISIQGAKRSGFAAQPLTIIGNGAVLEGSDSISGEKWEYVGQNVFRYLPRRISFQLLYLNGTPAEKVVSIGAVPARLSPLQWTQHQGWLYFCVEPGKVPYQYDLACCARSVGITLYQVRNVDISDLVIQGFQYDGINASDLVENARVLRCTLRGNGRSGVSVGGASHLDLYGCLIGDNGYSQVRCEGFCRLTIENCDIIEQSGVLSLDHQGGKVFIDGKSIKP